MIKDDRKKYIHNHFIQKGFIKSWVINDKVKYVIIESLKVIKNGEFNINDKKQPIAKNYFYLEKIEKEMNEIEAEGLRVVNEINQFALHRKEIKLNRQQMVSLRIYLLLASWRTNSTRKKIDERDGMLYLMNLSEMIVDQEKKYKKVI